jgi:DNA-directed RNA polymerase subunit D
MAALVSEGVFHDVNLTARENTITFRLAPTHVAYANTLRRLCMTSVETVGFRSDIKDDGSTADVRVLSNSTPMTNEMLAHRIGLLPIHVSNPLAWDADKYKFVLNKVNREEKTIDVCAGDFKILEKRGEEYVEIPSHQFFRPHSETSDTCLIATLKPLMAGGNPEEIHIEAKASVGVGRENARFIPTSQCAYAYTRDRDPLKEKEVFERWLQTAKDVNPADLEQDQKRKGELIREFNTLEINRCFLKDETGEPYSFDFTIESVGVLHPAAILARACQKGSELCKPFAEDALGADVVVQSSEGQLLGYDFFFQKQDHTLGHLLQAWIDKNLVDRGDITFVGYDIPHPLRDEMVIRIGVRDGKEETARAALKAAAQACYGMFEQWYAEWTRKTQVVQPVARGASVGANPLVRRVVKRPVLATGP